MAVHSCEQVDDCYGMVAWARPPAPGIPTPDNSRLRVKTDTFFHTIFKQDPSLILELLDLPMEEQYSFESITVKDTEKRIDGLLRAKHGKAPNLFVEFQGYQDVTIYWRALREVSTWYEQNGAPRTPAMIVVFFLDKNLDPGASYAFGDDRLRLVRAYLPECLAEWRARHGGHVLSPLVVLEPLVLESAEGLPEKAAGWASALNSLNLDEKDRMFWLERLEYALVQRFPNLTLAEIQAMLQLTPLEKTTAGQELVAMGMEEGLKKGIQRGIQKGLKKGLQKGMREGLQKGEVIGEIRMCQRMLGLPVTPRSELVELPLKRLRELLEGLEQKR